MTNKYKDPSFTPMQLQVLLSLDGKARQHLEISLLASTIDPISSDYETWVEAWKQLYAHISAWTRAIKKMEDSAGTSEHALALVSLRYVANTMLNARQLMKDRRRSAFMALEAANLA